MPVERIPAIIGVGSELPGRGLTTADVQNRLYADNPTGQRIVRVVGKMTGIEERHWVTRGEQASSDLGVIALRKAVEMAGINLSDITSVGFATSSPDYIGLPTAAILQDKLGMSDHVRFFDIGGNACVGLLQAIRTTFADISSEYGNKGPQAVLGVEVLSGTLPGANADVATIFGDGGSAMIIDMVAPDAGAPTKMGFAFGADGSLAEQLYIPAGGSKNFTTAETVAQNMHVIRMDGKVIKEQAVRRMVEMAQSAMADAGITSKDAILIPHQANSDIMREVAGQLEFPADQIVSTIAHTGNTSAASTGIALSEAVNAGMVKRNDFVVMVAFGSGITYGALAFPMVGLPGSPRT